MRTLAGIPFMKSQNVHHGIPTVVLLCPFALALLVFRPAIAGAGSMTNLVCFCSTDYGAANPGGGLALCGDTLYGTTLNGGSNSVGTIFSVHTDGTCYTNIFSLPGGTAGANPAPGVLVVSNGVLYGATQYGGTNGRGTIYRINTDGSAFTNLYTFSDLTDQGTNGDGAYPEAGLVLSGTTLYGTTTQGGRGGIGTIFRVETDGSGFITMRNMSWGDGVGPAGTLLLAGGTLYGEAPSGGPGTSFWGVIFRINIDGTGFTNVYNFDGINGSCDPNGGLVLSGDRLYGVEGVGGPWGVGAVFRVDTNGLNFTNLFIFNCDAYGHAPDGSEPVGGLALSGNTLYGATRGGGATHGNASYGVVFAINTDGSQFTNLFDFDYAVYGSDAYGRPLISGSTLYGTTSNGGGGGDGTVFALTLAAAQPSPIPLNIGYSGNAAVLSWTNSAFSLWASPNVSGNYTNVPGAASPYTNTSTDPQRFFRLIAN